MAHNPSIVDVLLVHSAPREAVELLTDLHSVSTPLTTSWDGTTTRRFADGPSYTKATAGPTQRTGSMSTALVPLWWFRPDGYTGLVASLDSDGRNKMGRWFDAVLRTSS